MADNKTHIVSLEKIYATEPATIFDLFKNAIVFKLTGADTIQCDFKSDGLFCLTFNERGTIHGRFIKITPNDILIEWNVDGFDRPKEIKTLVEITLLEKDKKCALTLHHKNIQHASAAAAKQKAWKEILDEVENYISSRIN